MESPSGTEGGLRSGMSVVRGCAAFKRGRGLYLLGPGLQGIRLILDAGGRGLAPGVRIYRRIIKILRRAYSMVGCDSSAVNTDRR